MKRNNPYINPIPMIKQEKPWEMGMVGAYSSVVFDKKVENLIDDKAKGGQFRCFYEGFEPGLTRSYLCYAESQDGCVWIKPELNLVDWDGSTANNILLSPEMTPFNAGTHGANIFIDSNPKCHPEEKYKGSFKCGLPGPGEVHVMTSPDGFHWKFHGKSVCHAHADSQNVIFYDQNIEKYRGFFRNWQGEKRSVLTAETDNFFQWPESRLLFDVDPNAPLGIDFYTPGVQHWPGTTSNSSAFIAMPAMFNRVTDQTYIDLWAQSHGLTWHRIGLDSYIPNGPLGSTSGGMLFAGTGIFQPKTEPPCWSFPLFQSPDLHRHGGINACVSSAIYRADLPIDGFICISAPTRGDFWTVPLEFEGDNLYVTGQTTLPNGYLKVELIDAVTGEILNGVSLTDCIPVIGQFIHQSIQWKNGTLTDYSDCILRLHFELNGCDLHAFQFDK
jgi:hypothetical protein